MAERGTNDKSNKTLRSYLVYDYILKKTTTNTFQIGKLNAYLEAYGIKCDIEVNIFNLNMHQTPLPHSRAEQKIRHDPALILGKRTLLDTRLFE